MCTAAPGIALEDLKQDFETEGYAVARGLFPAAEIAEIRAHFQAFHHRGEAGYDDGVRDPSDPLHAWPRIVHPHRFDALARRYMLHPAVLACLEALLQEKPVAVQSMYYFKPPGARGQAMHQDNLYLLVQPGTCIAAWTAIDRADRENGCMMIVPKSHTGNLLCQEKANEKESFTGGITPTPPGLKAVAVPMEPGDTLFFNGTAIHGSGPNRSKDRFRRSFIGHYAAGSLRNISKFYLPLVRIDGTDMEVAGAAGGGVCGEKWEGALH